MMKWAKRIAKAVLRAAFSAAPRRLNRRYVLLVCNQGLMADYLAEIWHLLKPDSRLRFRLLMPSSEAHPGVFEHIRRTLPVKEVRLHWAMLFRWDLAILADHAGQGIVDTRRSQVLRLQHGVPGKRASDEVYAFGRGAHDAHGRIVYTRVFVSSAAVKSLAVRTDPAFEDVVVVVGSLSDDRLLTETVRREEYRRRLGLEQADIAVLVMSTFGPMSLFHRIGDAFLAEARRLQHEFRFILSAHPLEYRPGRPGERVWGEYLRTQVEHGFRVREPSESWIPYLIACDIVVTDHTSVSTHAAVLGRPLVYVPMPEGVVERGCLIWQLHDISPGIREDASDLRDALLRARGSYPFDKMRDLAAQMNSYPGEAAARVLEETYAMLGLDGPGPS